MSQISGSSHVRTMLSDYVLELLPGDKSAEVGAHITRCPDCRRALARERNVGRLVQNTLDEMPTPAQDRMQQLMPPPPAGRGRAKLLLAFSPGWAAAGIMLLIICSTFLLYLNQRPGIWTFTSPTAWSTAVIMTDTPTQTATRDFTATVEQSAVHSPSNDTQTDQNDNGVAAPKPALVPAPAAPLLH